MTFRCVCCESDNKASEVLGRDMMYGGDEVFPYSECGDCGSLQILKVPENLGNYYREPYSSWTSIPAYIDEPSPLWKTLLRRARFKHLMGLPNRYGKLSAKLLGDPEFPFPIDWFRRAKAGPDSAILDFGCGNARLLRYLKHNGYSKLEGVDRFVDQKLLPTGILVSECLPHNKANSYDLVMAHHVLEHMQNPLETLASLGRHLKTNGTLLVRVPLAQTYAWRRYGINWVQFDPPRHLVLPTETSMRIMCERANLKIVHIEYDSTEFMFLGSEQYQANITMYDENKSFLYERNPDLFTTEQIHSFRTEAKQLNQKKDGDQACFYLQRITD